MIDILFVVFLQDSDRGGHLVPADVELLQGLLSLSGQRVIFPRWSLGALLPFILQQSVFLQPVEQRIERSFHHNHLCLFQPPDDVVGIEGPVSEQEEHAIVEHALSHLRFGVVYICHFILFLV